MRISFTFVMGFMSLKEIFRIEKLGKQNELGMQAVVNSLNALNERIRRN